MKRPGTSITTPGTIVAIALFAAQGCATTSRQAREAPSPERRRAVYTLADVEFDQALFYKPRSVAAPDPETYLLPLIVQETTGTGSADDSPGRFGEVVVTATGAPIVDATRPTIYTGQSTVRINNTEYARRTYVWAYPSANGDDSVRWRGVRITFGADDYPLVWECLAPDDDVRRLFVSESLELAAGDRFGEPLPGRRYAVEPSVARSPDTVVVRVVADGPVPMGPYVYVTADGLQIATVLCRCSPSQVNRFVDNLYYEVRPLDALSATGLDLPEMADSIADGLRWPLSP